MFVVRSTKCVHFPAIPRSLSALSTRFMLDFVNKHQRKKIPKRHMASSSTSRSPEASMQDFHVHLKKSKRVLALCGAGLSAASGLPTFRGAGGLWRTHDATSLATPEGAIWRSAKFSSR